MSERGSIRQNAWFRKPLRAPASTGTSALGVTDAFLGPADATDPLLTSTRMSGGSGLEDGPITLPQQPPKATGELKLKPSTAKDAPTADDAFQNPEDPDIRRPLPFDEYPET